MAGMSLFLNTFGWEIIGAILVLTISSQTNRRKDVWSWFCFYQLLEAAGSCISVSLMRRHLMVWAIFAPRFVFACVFTLIGLVFWLLGLILMTERETNPNPRPARIIVQSNRRSHLLSIFFALSCITSSTSAYSTLTIVDAENVRGKSNFRLRHDELVDAVGWWTETQEKNCDDSHYNFCSLVIDHGSRPSSFYHPLKRTTGDSADGIAILFSGPNEKADDVIARDVGQIASESVLNGSDLKVIRVVTSDQGLRSRCRVAIDEALAPRTKKKNKKPSGRRKGSSRKRRASSSGSLSLEFLPSIAFLSQLERELARHGTDNSQVTIGNKISSDVTSENLVNELHEDIELRGKLYQVETSLRDAKKLSNTGQKRTLIEKGCKISQQIYNSRDDNGQTILERILKPDTNGVGELDIEEALLSGWHEIRCDAGRAELTGDRMVQAEHLRRQLEKQVADRQSTDPSMAESRAFSPSELHYHCHKRFHGGIQRSDVPCTTSAFDKAVEKIRLVIVSGPVSSDVEPLPEGDVLLHTGDFTIPDDDPRTPTGKRNDKSITEFDEWFSSHLHPIKLVLRGMKDPPAAKVQLPKSKAFYLDRPSTISFGGGNFLMTLVPYCTERDLSSAWRRLPHTFDTLVCRQVFHEAQMIANRVELMFSGPPQLWLAGDISRGDYGEYEHVVAKSSISMRGTSIICGKEWDSEVGTDNLKPFVVDLTKHMGSDELKFDIID